MAKGKKVVTEGERIDKLEDLVKGLTLVCDSVYEEIQKLKRLVDGA